MKLKSSKKNEDQEFYGEEMPKKKSVCQEADELVSGARQSTYGHPFQNFTETAQIWQAILGRKLAPGARITPEEVGLCMIGVKIAREVNKPKRDNLVDICGYAKTLEMCKDHREEAMTELVRLTEEMGLYDDDFEDAADPDDMDDDDFGNDPEEEFDCHMEDDERTEVKPKIVHDIGEVLAEQLAPAFDLSREAS